MLYILIEGGFFFLINYARFLNINPDTALERANKKFISRFQHMETALQAEGKSFDNMSLAEMDVYWDKAKETETNTK